MAAEWRETTIGAMCDSGIAEIQTGPFGSRLHAHDYVADGVPVVPTEAIRDRRIDHSVLPKVSPEKATQLARHKLREGDILFARRGVQATGHIGYVRSAERDFLCGTGAIRLRVNRAADSLDPDYLSHVLANPAAVAWFKFHAIGATMPNLNEGIICSFPLKLPPLPEQRAIAHILGTLDDKIELNRRMSETLEAMARALFRSWFVDFEPVRAKMEGRDPGLLKPLADLFPARLVDSELGEIPERWKAAPLSEWVDALSGGTPSKSERAYWDGIVPWISPKVMTAIHADEAEACVSESAIGNGTRLAPALSTLVMVRGMGLHESVRVSQARREVTFNQDVKALVGVSIEPTLLLFALLDSQAFLLDRVESSGHGTGKLASEVLLALPVVMPDGGTQRRLAAPLRALNDRIATTRAESNTLAALRDALLPKLISGELRVKHASRFSVRVSG